VADRKGMLARLVAIRDSGTVSVAARQSSRHAFGSTAWVMRPIEAERLAISPQTFTLARADRANYNPFTEKVRNSSVTVQH
jgi:hypothetical protein